MEFKKHTIILAVIERLRSRGSWTGKTHVQKTMALLDLAGRMSVPMDLILYKHGPYSYSLEAELEQMRSYSAIEIVPNAEGYGVTIKPGEMAGFVKAHGALTPNEESEIDRVCEFVGNRNVTELERLATAGWIISHEGIETTEKVAERLHELKPHVSMEAAGGAAREVAELLKHCT